MARRKKGSTQPKEEQVTIPMEDENDETSEEEIEGVVNTTGISDVLGRREEADKEFQRALRDELGQVHARSKTLNSMKSLNEDLIHCIKGLDYINSFSTARFQDILPQVIDGRKFVIDGDSLLMLALNSKGLSRDAGGQTLHILYVVEQFLQTFVARGLNFSIVFFEVWNHCWNYSPPLSIARNCLKLHLQHNQSQFPIKTMKSLWSSEFMNYLQSQRPGFIMLAISLPGFISEEAAEKTTSENISARWLQFICGSQSIYCEFLCLDVVDISSVLSSSMSLMAMVHVHVNNFKKIQSNVERMIRRMEERMPTLEEPQLELWEQTEHEIKVSLTVQAAAATLNKVVRSDAEEVIKTILLCTVLSEFMPLKMRCFKFLPKLPEHITEILNDFLKEMGALLCCVPHESECIDFKRVGDLWQGLLFKAVFHCVCSAGSMNRSKLGDIIAHRYEELMTCVNALLLKKKLQPYPIWLICKGSKGKSGAGKVAKPAVLLSPGSISSKLLPSTCTLVDLFCGNFASDSQFVSTSQIDDLSFGPYCNESRHWHSKKTLTDEYERISDNNYRVQTNSWHVQKSRNTMARYLTLYGSSLEGRAAPRVIVVNPEPERSHPKKSYEKSKTQTKAKLSKKDKIVEENTKRIQEGKLKQLKDRFKTFLKVFESLMLKGDHSKAKEKCDIELVHVTEFGDLMMEILFLKGEACFAEWKDECNIKEVRRNIEAVKEVFLVTREIFKLAEERSISLSTKQTNISEWIHKLGFKAFAKVKGLLEDPSKMSGNCYNAGMNHVEFQLTHLGADLVRDTGGIPDSRADGFIPDPWQVQLFDIIDKNQCAVVVAPTSSGKTYASYYCMEKVIRESDDGVVVYVCPTKALVNQVYATIYARFRKNLPAGKALIGIFTREYKQNAKNCQILVTVPQCLELLLLGPRSQTWSQLIRFVIFDEVHCLVGQAGGAAWENSIMLIRCPYLALSATIHEPKKFCAWLQKVEDFKKVQAEKYRLIPDRSSSSYKVNLVEHMDRHNHLLKNVMMEDGSIKHVHPYSFLNLSKSGIPAYIVLSPDEALDLYNAMKSILPAERLEMMSLVEYFQEKCPSGYLTMQSVKKFSDDLRSLLEKEEIEDQMRVLKKLTTVDYSKLETGNEFILNNIPLVMKSLKERGMLPAIVFTYNRVLVQALPQRLLTYLREIDDFPENEDSDVEVDSDADDAKQPVGNKPLRRVRGKKYSKKLGLTRGPSMLKSEGSLRGEGFTDEKLIDYIEYRLLKLGYKSQDTFPSLLRRGLGQHYGAMNNKERSAVEMLFRSKVLNLVAATGTLALGIHMPCKTVVLAGDSPFLNALEFHQMSGRAGRRGFDKEGNVVFFGLNQRKLVTLMTGNLPQMVGNFPLSLSLILRLLLLVSDATLKGKSTEQASNEALVRAYTLLENGLLYESQPLLKDKMKYFFFFAVQLLRCQNLMSLDGHLNPDALIITHLHYKEPGNFAFYYILQSGVLENMCQLDRKGNVTEKSLLDLMIVLNFLFARLPISKHLLEQERHNSIVLLPPLPQIVKKELEGYNSKVLAVFSHYFKCVSVHIEKRFGKETKLPLSQLHIEANNVLPEQTTFGEGTILSSLNKLHTCNHVCSVFAGLSGISDQDLFPISGEIAHIRDELNVKIIPTVELDFECNSYAYDFYKHGNKKALSHDNGLKSGDDFAAILDFLLILKSILVSLSEMLSPDAKLLKALRKMVSIFEYRFGKAYGGLKGP